MKIVKILLFAVMALILFVTTAFVAAGLLVPESRSFANEIEINAPADVVWQVINDRGKYTEWQTNLTKVDIVDDKNWVEYPKDSPEPLKFSLAKDERPNGMEFDYTIGASFAGKWTGELTQTSWGSKLKTVDSYSAKGWVTKILIYAFFDMKVFSRDWNNKLKQRAESLNR